ncbi:MAG: uracil-DNA glycosylase [Thiomicrorhabdus sp.]|nr:uracil-DNA glycosylase [Thiomicrorhabdus sp.]
MKNSPPIDCFRCHHFFVTWDSNNPRGCKAFGFKTTQLPSAVVLETSGEPCLKYSPKNPPTNSNNRNGWIA